jgi:magnesium-transporting ATPase (P-type)
MTGERFRRAVGGLESIEDPDSKKIKLTVTNKFAFRKIMKQLKVLARSTPEDKHLLVVGL